MPYGNLALPLDSRVLLNNLEASSIKILFFLHGTRLLRQA